VTPGDWTIQQLQDGLAIDGVYRLSVWNLTPEPNRTKGMISWERFLRDGEQSGAYPLRRKDGTLVRTTYFATAHVLPGLHLSALATGALVRRLTRKTHRKSGSEVGLPPSPNPMHVRWT
jgi:hypothetical protein